MRSVGARMLSASAAFVHAACRACLVQACGQNSHAALPCRLLSYRVEMKVAGKRIGDVLNRWACFAWRGGGGAAGGGLGLHRRTHPSSGSSGACWSWHSLQLFHHWLQDARGAAQASRRQTSAGCHPSWRGGSARQARGGREAPHTEGCTGEPGHAGSCRGALQRTG